MAQFDFLGTWNDSWDILTAILEDIELRLVPDLLYEKPEPVFLTRIDDTARELLRVKRNGFIWSTRFSVFPPAMNLINGGEANGKYCVGLLEGGPYLRLVLPACFEEAGVVNLGAGMLSYPKWTTKPGTNEVVKPSPKLRLGFKEVKAVIKSRLVRLKVRPDIWAGHEANSLLEMHSARIHGFDRNPKGDT